MNNIRLCKVYLTENSQIISHNIYLTRLFMASIPDGQMSLPGGHAAVCQVKHLDRVTIRIHLYLYTCILVYSLELYLFPTLDRPKARMLNDPNRI